MTDTDDVALLEIQVAVLLILHLRFSRGFLLKIRLRFRGSFFCNFIAWPRTHCFMCVCICVTVMI